MSRPPRPVAAYVVLMVFPLCVALASAAVSVVLAIAVLIIVGLLAGLWRGNRFAWWGLLALEVSVLVSVPFDPPDWWWIVANVAGLTLLLLPPTRRYIWGKHQGRQMRSTSGSA